MAEKFEFGTKLWQRSKNSYATTVPQEILAIKGVAVESETDVKWSINEQTGAVEVRFESEDD